MFSPTVIEKALTLSVSADPVMPGTWHVRSGDNEYRVQTDEDLWEDTVNWASCDCEHAAHITSGVPRCSHVAAVLMRILADREEE